MLFLTVRDHPNVSSRLPSEPLIGLVCPLLFENHTDLTPKKGMLKSDTGW